METEIVEGGGSGVDLFIHPEARSVSRVLLVPDIGGD